MNDRVQTALRGLGIGTTPVAVLEQGEAFFALLEDLLVYQDQNGTRRVTLRDLTRIHSDQNGLLRVETPAGTALTASLLGYDPAQVQAFFAQVRDATARAKNLPAAPLPTPGGHKTFGSVPKSSPQSAPAPAVSSGTATPTPPAPTPAASTVVLGAVPGTVSEDRKEPVKREERPVTPTPSPVQDKTAATPRPGTVQEVRGQPAPAPVTAPPAAQTPATQTPATQTPAVATPAPTPVPSKPAVRAAAAGAESLLPALATRANAVGGLVGRLQLLAVVLGLAAVGLAVFQYLDGARLGGMWTLIAGGVGCIALLAFADVTRLLVSLARAVAEGGRGTSPADRTQGNGTDDAGA
ncbi:hypothetical protein Dcar01_00344 [Deinococcus carri]|uniref:Uncharacterized protein n=1 Tax=Deinococcus carri TaxID=1211323 RepID=A0ABP9W2Q0_9DEIO